jgi:hypothetical protein
MKIKTSLIDPLEIFIRETYSHKLRRNVYTGNIELEGKPLGIRDMDKIWHSTCKSVGKVPLKFIHTFIRKYAVDYIPVSSERNGVKIEYGIHLGKPVLLLPYIRGKKRTEICPYCSTTHYHSVQGHRSQHCEDIKRCTRKKNVDAIKHPDGTLLFKSDGYLVNVVNRKTK